MNEETYTITPRFLEIVYDEPRSATPGSLANVFYRDRKGKIVGSWWAMDYLRQWLDDSDLWALLEAMPPNRLARFGVAVQAQVTERCGAWGPWLRTEAR